MHDHKTEYYDPDPPIQDNADPDSALLGYLNKTTTKRFVSDALDPNMFIFIFGLFQ